MTARFSYWVLVLGAVASARCSSDNAFVCDQDGDCGNGGVCQASNYCAFPDDSCESGLKYPEHAGELAGLCVVDEAMTEGGTSVGTTGPVVTSSTGSDATDATDATGGDGSTGDPPGVCTCFDAPNDPSWSGPVFLRTSGELTSLPECPAQAPTELFDAGRQLQVGKATCEAQPQCGADVAIFDDICPMNGGMATHQLSSAECTDVGGFGMGGMLGATLTVLSCECEEGRVTEDIPEPAWTGAGRLCGGGPADCTDGLCLPPPSAAAGDLVCVHQDGDMDCPLAGYTQKILLHRAFEDTRACNPCNTDQCEVALFADRNCETPSAILDGAGCQSLQGERVSHLGIYTEGCEGGVTGSADAVDPVTVCCIPG